MSDIESWTEWELGGFPWELPEKMRQHNPFRYAENVATPTLILHADRDRRCPIAVGTGFYRALRRRGVETQMVQDQSGRAARLSDRGFGLHGGRQNDHRSFASNRFALS